MLAPVLLFSLWVFKDAQAPGILKTEQAPSQQITSGENQEFKSPFSLEALRHRLPPEGVAKVHAHIELFRVHQHKRITGGLGRSNRYMQRYRKIFQQYGVPEELTYLPLIESGFTETAVSPAQAVGMWQFIASTGKLFDLHTNQWSDGRRDPIQSAHAAARYLHQLHQRFNNWELSLAAYNAGANTVRWAMRRNQRAGKPTNFWHLDLPEETQNYVPALLATVVIAKNPEAFGLKVRFEPQLHFEEIQVGPAIHLNLLAGVMDVPLAKLRELNPRLLRDTIPPAQGIYSLRIPSGSTQYLLEQLNTKTEKPWVLHYQNEQSQNSPNGFVIKESPIPTP